MNDSILATPDLRVDSAFFDLLSSSYARLLGEPLLPEGRGAVWLYHEAPFAVLAHSKGVDPIFLYANKAAQACFGYSWEEFMTLPSRESADPAERASRQAMLERVKRDGFISDYHGRRVAKSGGEFWIEKGVVWQLTDHLGLTYGQAATFPVP